MWACEIGLFTHGGRETIIGIQVLKRHTERAMLGSVIIYNQMYRPSER